MHRWQKMLMRRKRQKKRQRRRRKVRGRISAQQSWRRGGWKKQYFHKNIKRAHKPPQSCASLKSSPNQSLTQLSRQTEKQAHFSSYLSFFLKTKLLGTFRNYELCERESQFWFCRNNQQHNQEYPHNCLLTNFSFETVQTGTNRRRERR